MDVDTEASLPCVTSRDYRFVSAKRPRTDETGQHHCPANSRDGFHQHESENGLFSKRSDASQMPAGSSWQGCRRFLTIHAGCSIFESEDCRPKGETLYTPLREDVIINTRNIEQFTFVNGSFFIGDESSRFRKTVQGVCLNMWRFDSQAKKLYISRSFVFSNPQEAQGIKRILESM